MRRLLSAIFALLLFSSAAHAGAYCAEHVTMIIMQGDSINFETDKSCPNWCEISPTWSTTAQDRAYATLITAHTAGESV